MPIKNKTVTVSLELADLINQLEPMLKAEFGCDYAYTILGKGVVLGASHYPNVHVTPNAVPKNNLTKA